MGVVGVIFTGENLDPWWSLVVLLEGEEQLMEDVRECTEDEIESAGDKGAGECVVRRRRLVLSRSSLIVLF